MSGHHPLERQLDAYSLRAGRRVRRTTLPELAGYAAAAGGLAFTGGDAVGAVLHNSAGTSFSWSSVGSNTFFWDIDGGGVDLMLYGVAEAGAGNYLSVSAYNSAVAIGNATAPRFAYALAPGFVVGATLLSGTFADLQHLMDNSTQGNFVNTTAYLGFRFAYDFDAAGGFKYGWAKIRTEVFGASNQGLQVNIFEWAWDDSGAPIAVGDVGPGSPVPAPSTPLLTLLGLGAMGVRRFRSLRDSALAS